MKQDAVHTAAKYHPHVRCINSKGEKSNSTRRCLADAPFDMCHVNIPSNGMTTPKSGPSRQAAVTAQGLPLSTRIQIQVHPLTGVTGL